MYTPIVSNPPSLEACYAAFQNNLKHNHDPQKSEVAMTVRFGDEERPMTLLLINAWAHSDHAAPQGLREHEYAIVGVLEHAMIKLKIMVIVDTQTTTGHIRECVSYPKNLVNPWPFIPTKPTTLTSEEEKILLALSTPIQNCRFYKEDTLNTKLVNSLNNAGYWYLWQLAELQEGVLLIPGKSPKGIGTIGYRITHRELCERGLDWGMDLTRFRTRLPQPTT